MGSTVSMFGKQHEADGCEAWARQLTTLRYALSTTPSPRYLRREDRLGSLPWIKLGWCSEMSPGSGRGGKGAETEG